MIKDVAVREALASGCILAQCTKRGDGYLFYLSGDRRVYRNDIGEVPGRMIQTLLKKKIIQKTELLKQPQRLFFTINTDSV